MTSLSEKTKYSPSKGGELNIVYVVSRHSSTSNLLPLVQKKEEKSWICWRLAIVVLVVIVLLVLGAVAVQQLTLRHHSSTFTDG